MVVEERSVIREVDLSFLILCLPKFTQSRTLYKSSYRPLPCRYYVKLVE